MTNRIFFHVLAVAVLAALAAFTQTALAEPIMPAKSGIDPNTFIVGHPASPRWRVVHAGNEHPAVLQSRAGRAGIDANTFTVQPPASVTWLANGEQAPGEQPRAVLAAVAAAAAPLNAATQR